MYKFEHIPIDGHQILQPIGGEEVPAQCGLMARGLGLLVWGPCPVRSHVLIGVGPK